MSRKVLYVIGAVVVGYFVYQWWTKRQALQSALSQQVPAYANF